MADSTPVRLMSRSGQALLVAVQRTAAEFTLSFDHPSDAMTLALRTTGLRHLLAKPPSPTGNMPVPDA